MRQSLVFAGIAPHPPLLIPGVGGDRISEVVRSHRAMNEFSQHLVNSGADCVVLISPHSPLDPQYFLARATPALDGDFAQFRAPQIKLHFENDLELLDAIERSAADEGIGLRRITGDCPLDHGALVPLYYLDKAGWKGRTAVIGFTLQDNDRHLAFGRAIGRAASDLGRKLAFVASGDLSHRLIVGGPYEFEPTAHRFDEQMVEGIGSGKPEIVLGIDPNLRQRAGECGYRSIVIALGLASKHLTGSRVLSYEGPFGVGYMVAILAG
jgi:aromatic ring-opening dioxygenase LigB subunit